MKKSIKVLSLLIIVVVVCGIFTACGKGKSYPNGEVRVYNWGDYIDIDILEQFSEETGIKVIYDTFETNEDMYLKIKNSTSSTYDVLIPSDYMIKKMADEGLLAEINFDNVPNIKNIDPKFLNREYDVENKYSVPYQTGTVCIAYNTEKVKEPVDSWDILWDEKYSGQIFMMNSQRDSIAVALLKLGYSINTDNVNELEEAKKALLEQKPLILAWTGDDIKDKMISEEGVLGVVWSCDAGLILQDMKDLGVEGLIDFAIPKEGTNLWFDSAVILKNAKNKENAEKFIDFLCREDIALKNAEYLGSTSPVIKALEQLPNEIKNNTVLNPTEEQIEKYEVFLNDPKLTSIYESIWTEVMFNVEG